MAHLLSEHTAKLQFAFVDQLYPSQLENGLGIRWGAAWHINRFDQYDGTAEQAMLEYIDLRRSQGRRPFIDAPHFEITQL